MRVLITRPRPDADTLAARLRRLGHEPLIAPLLSVEINAEARVDLTDVQAVLLTSANGARALAAATAERNVRLLTVGAATAAAARTARFHRVATADGDVEALRRLAEETLDRQGGKLLHVAGRDVAGDLVGALTRAGFATDRVVLYRAETATDLPEPLSEALGTGTIDAALFYSPRTAATFALLVGAAGLTQACEPVAALCLSDAVAAALRPLLFQRLLVAAEPTQDALLATLGAVAKAPES